MLNYTYIPSIFNGHVRTTLAHGKSLGLPGNHLGCSAWQATSVPVGPWRSQRAASSGMFVGIYWEYSRYILGIIGIIGNRLGIDWEYEWEYIYIYWEYILGIYWNVDGILLEYQWQHSGKLMGYNGT